MTSIGLVKQLVDLVEEFEKVHDYSALNITTFTSWLSVRIADQSDNTEYKITGYGLEPELAAHVGRLSRYANNYIKVTLEELPFATDMEFTFTAILDKVGKTGKTDLIRMMAYDKSSGMSVINRLMKKGFVEEFPNPEDKRGKLIRLTDKGRAAAQEGYEKVPIAANMVTKNLSTAEKHQLLYLLKKLDDFHYPIYLNEQERMFL
ncbi:MAG: MarR family winged helix-turn-helix transcriptional regulator [Croceivirga sp.]